MNLNIPENEKTPLGATCKLPRKLIIIGMSPNHITLSKKK